MSSLIRWDPFRDTLSLRNAMDRLFEDSFVTPRLGWLAPASAAGLALDVYETKDEVVVKAALPGVKPDDTQVTITGDTLTIRGEAKEEKEIKEENYIRKERNFGSFARSLTLPAGLKADKAEATFENGVLTLKIPKSEEVKPKSIKVKAK
ncbi:MAG: Hsp20/alpha crystallin family protein [Chloroflexota bacterium]